MDLKEKNENGITRADVKKIANDLKISITDEKITSIWKDYDEVIGDYPDENWSFIIEDLLWNLDK